MLGYSFIFSRCGIILRIKVIILVLCSYGSIITFDMVKTSNGNGDSRRYFLERSGKTEIIRYRLGLFNLFSFTLCANGHIE